MKGKRLFTILLAMLMVLVLLPVQEAEAETYSDNYVFYAIDVDYTEIYTFTFILTKDSDTDFSYSCSYTCRTNYNDPFHESETSGPYDCTGWVKPTASQDFCFASCEQGGNGYVTLTIQNFNGKNPSWTYTPPTDALGHNVTSWSQGAEDDGYGTHTGTCQRCNQPVTERHSLKLVGSVGAEPGVPGNRQGYVCSVCGRHYEDEKGSSQLTDIQWIYYFLTVSVNDQSMGQAWPGSNSNNVNEEVSIYATASTGYEFDRWEKVSGDVTIGNAALAYTTATINSAGDASIIAYFRGIESTVAVTVNDASCGSASAGAAKARTGDTVTLNAVPEEGCAFDGWTVTGGTVSDLDTTAASTSFTMPGSAVTIQANFHKHSGGKATCTEKAECEVCEQEYGKPLGHELKEVKKTEPTCTEPGTEAHWKCTRDGCGKLFSDDKGENELDALPVIDIDKDAHDLEQHKAQAPTCTDVGWDAYETCKREGCTYTTYKEIPANGHKWKDWTPQEDGKTHKRTCANCNEFETGDHVWGDWKSVDPYDHQHDCTVCGEAYETEPHTYVNGVCSVCGRKCEHDTTEIRDAVESTCSKEGYTGDTWCLTCEMKVKDGEKIETKPHTEVIDKAVDPTCEKTGLTEGKHCSACGKTLVAQAVVKANGHTPGDAVKENEVAAKEGEAGSYDEVVYCKVCKAEISRKTVKTDPLPTATEAPTPEPTPEPAQEPEKDTRVWCKLVFWPGGVEESFEVWPLQGQTILLPEPDAREGYEFIGWYEGDIGPDSEDWVEPEEDDEHILEAGSEYTVIYQKIFTGIWKKAE